MSQLPKNRSIPSPMVIPVLPYPDVRAAVKWLEEVFGFKERLQIAEHRAQMNIGEGGAMIVAEYIGGQRPQVGADYTTHSTMVRIDDVNAHFEHVTSLGAEILEPLTDHVFGERQYVVRDIGGHRWTFSQTLRDMHPSDWADENVILKV
jgi:uncharacterized glyoxalase superfamily protein PhnB